MSQKKAKALRRQLSKLGNSIPLVMQEAKEKHFLKGSEYKELGQHNDGFKGEVEDDKLYAQDMPVQVAFNHNRRLKRAYRNSGNAGIGHYIDTLLTIANKQTA